MLKIINKGTNYLATYHTNYVIENTGAVLNKGEPVYLSGRQKDKVIVNTSGYLL